jgi:hypothetical protein
LRAGLIFGQTISSLDYAFELISAASDLVQIIIREIASFLIRFQSTANSP